MRSRRWDRAETQTATVILFSQILRSLPQKGTRCEVQMSKAVSGDSARGTGDVIASKVSYSEFWRLLNFRIYLNLLSKHAKQWGIQNSDVFRKKNLESEFSNIQWFWFSRLQNPGFWFFLCSRILILSSETSRISFQSMQIRDEVKPLALSPRADRKPSKSSVAIKKNVTRTTDSSISQKSVRVSQRKRGIKQK